MATYDDDDTKGTVIRDKQAWIIPHFNNNNKSPCFYVICSIDNITIYKRCSIMVTL